jgi:hypothetical protein
MAIIKITPDDQETFSVTTNPIRSFSSSSSGITGSVNVFARRSKIEKNFLKDLPGLFFDVNISSDLQTLQSKALKANSIPNGNFQSGVQSYLDKVNKQFVSTSKSKKLNIKRFIPSKTFTSDTIKKLYVKDILMPHYRTSYPTANWAYTNYNSLNFFTSSMTPMSSALLYPHVFGYTLFNDFSFDFYINPRYKSDPNKEFKAGTIFHLSSAYAISLVSGSAKDENGRTTGYRIQLQLSHSADILPSLAKPGNKPHDLVFLSDDNSLSWNNWHHVVIRWGTKKINEGTGSFNIDGIDKGIFVVPSSTINPGYVTGGPLEPPRMLSIGNFYEGNNSGLSKQEYFFAADVSKRDGIAKQNDATGINNPQKYNFNHPLNAEVHDLSIKRYYMTDLDIKVSSSIGPSYIDDLLNKSKMRKIAFYLPPYFTQTSSLRQAAGSPAFGGVPQTPSIYADGTTSTPYNVAMAYSVGGHYVNIENYLKDFASNNFPRLHHMTSSKYEYTGKETNEILYSDPFIRRRNLLIMPCDDGNFRPNYTLLAKEIKKDNSVDDLENQNLSLINLSNMISAKSLIFGTTFTDVEGVSATSAEQFVSELLGPTPENPNEPAGAAYQNFINKVKKQIAVGTYNPGKLEEAPLYIFHKTLDPSSDQVTLFDISNLYYGKKILPGSFLITDTNLSGSSGAMKVSLRDDGKGGIYRADSFTEHATWNNVGNIFYEEGIVVIKNPHLYFFGKNQYEISFRGEQNIHTLKLEVIAPRNQVNSSSNPNYKELPPTGYITDVDPNYVYISGLNFHDKDMNVVMKTQLAQPIVKRYGDRVMFKVTIDMLF